MIAVLADRRGALLDDEEQAREIALVRELVPGVDLELLDERCETLALAAAEPFEERDLVKASRIHAAPEASRANAPWSRR